MDDELQELRDNFFVGNFLRVLELNDLVQPTNDIAAAEKGGIIARTHLALSMMDKLKGLQNSPMISQQAVAYFAVYQRSKDPERQKQVISRLQEIVAESHDANAVVLAAAALASADDFLEALSVMGSSGSVEATAMKVQFFLAMNRVDLAEKAMGELNAMSEDSAVAKVVSSLVHMATGNHQEAYLTYCDLTTQYIRNDDLKEQSVMLLNGKAVANLQRGLWQEALEDLQRAVTCDPQRAELQANLACCHAHMKNMSEANQHFAKLKDVAPAHPLVVKSSQLDAAFARFASSA